MELLGKVLLYYCKKRHPVHRGILVVFYLYLTFKKLIWYPVQAPEAQETVSTHPIIPILPNYQFLCKHTHIDSYCILNMIKFGKTRLAGCSKTRRFVRISGKKSLTKPKAQLITHIIHHIRIIHITLIQFLAKKIVREC